MNKTKQKKCVVCGKECTGDLSNFLDKKTKKPVDNIHDYKFGDMIYQSPVCFSHYHMNHDDWAWMLGGGYYSQ